MSLRTLVGYDGECRTAKRVTRKLERVYRRHRHSTAAYSGCISYVAWREHFGDQWLLW